MSESEAEEKNPRTPRQSENIPLYLSGDFSKELNYKLWSTKGARFSAAERMRLKHRLSTRAVSFLAAYLIVFNLLEILILKSSATYAAEVQTFINISLSVVILVYSQLEAAGNYLLRFDRYHTCAMGVASLYNRLRQLKTTEKDVSIESRVKTISDEYEDFLARYENHEPIDFKIFKSQKPKYEDHNLNWFQVRVIKIEYYFRTSFFYHLSIFVPPIAIIAYLIWRP
ncbi:MAG: SLATT domain-containing protein [Verrucomicrobiota bacterium]